MQVWAHGIVLAHGIEKWAHGIVLTHGIEKGARGIEGSWYCFGSWY